MTKTKRQDEIGNLPEPIALTPDQLKEIAAKTAGGTTAALSKPIIIAGGIRVPM